ncbi:hypothetical protein [Clostridium ljungdahlii]|uniref:Uncharacterized protein n=1 Tax=Clostridium ljungdahlii (strain ATCC 55383 / DSM 13528 / PETC) TaxID=748727 RepID=D8GQ89_CLOLD|nr:hypothetical protein [Clostridium ljungdahlii]ADK16180.1 hypothetical protein CLJU_c31320 [Clostridium ljungdahlii DSM 13528]OAA89951.1 hypothetical protein WX45_01790 [Clostridium ljungdahlii DSM 13528]
MRQSTTTIMDSQVNILKYNQYFLPVNLKVAKTATTLNAKGILPAGTIIDATGKVVNDGTAFGIVYENVDFNNSMGTENVSVLIFGFVDASKLPTAPADAAKAALNMIKFM